MYGDEKSTSLAAVKSYEKMVPFLTKTKNYSISESIGILTERRFYITSWRADCRPSGFKRKRFRRCRYARNYFRKRRFGNFNFRKFRVTAKSGRNQSWYP